ncbi:MAG: anthranilate synthase component I, partial [Actinobacteria bacterium]|nr:anthranilate synthase component I [Actinomycetota bacterium]
MRIQPDRATFRELSAQYSVVPVWTEVLADVETPVSAYLKLVGDQPGFLLESVEHGERWSRYSFVGRNAQRTLVLRDGVVSADGPLPDGTVLDRGILAAMESLLEIYRAPFLSELPPLQGGLMGFLGFDVVREVEQLPEGGADDRGLPDAVMSMIGSLVAFDHWRQRAYVLE